MNRLAGGLLLVALLLLSGCGTQEQVVMQKEEKRMAQTFYEIKVRTAEGESKALSAYQGEVLLIVNVASRCGFTKQYAGLEAMYDKYKGQGLRILAFPSNDFGAQEPGTIEEVKEFCTLNYGVTFDLFDKVHAKGPEQAELYQYLTQNAPETGDVRWNFEKFLISRDGQIVGRFASDVAPEDAKLVTAVEGALAK